MRRVLGSLQILVDFLDESLVLCVTRLEESSLGLLLVHELLETPVEDRLCIDSVHAHHADANSLLSLLFYPSLGRLKIRHLVYRRQIAHHSVTAAELCHHLNLIAELLLVEDLVEIGDPFLIVL